MKKSKAKARRFINHLYNKYDVPRIPIYIHWHHTSVITESGVLGFGVFMYGDDVETAIHISGKKIKTTGVLSVIAHEFTHYLQYLHGRDMSDTEQIEYDAENFGAALFGGWLSEGKKWEPLPAWECWKQEEK